GAGITVEQPLEHPPASGTGSADAPSAAGTYTVVAHWASNNPLYKSADSDLVTFTINQRALTVSAAGQDKVYDGTTLATVSLTDDRISGDRLDVSDSGAAFADKNVGSAKTVSVRGISFSGADAANYTLKGTTATTTATITPRSLT